MLFDDRGGPDDDDDDDDDDDVDEVILDSESNALRKLARVNIFGR